MKVTNNQLFWMITIMALGMTLLMTLTSAIEASRQDAWISLLVAGLLALVVAVVSTKLGVLYPNQTLVQFSQTILGKWLGKLVLLVYFVQWYTIIPIILHQFSDLINTLLLPETPNMVVMLMFVLLVAYATYSGGIDGIGRCSEILGPLVLVVVLLVLLTSVTNARWGNLLPFYTDSGALTIIKGSLAPASYLGHAVEFVMLASFLYTPRKGATFAIWGVVIASTIVMLSTVMVVATIGDNITPKMWFPFFEMSKKISLFGFIENLDALIVAIWIPSVFIKLSIYLFITSYGTAQFLGVKNWKRMGWFIPPVVIAFTMIPKNINEATLHYLNNYWVPFVLPVNMLGLPLLLLIVGKIRQRRSL